MTLMIQQTQRLKGPAGTWDTLTAKEHAAMTWLRSMGSPSSKRADTLQPKPHWIPPGHSNKVVIQPETFVRR